MIDKRNGGVSSVRNVRLEIAKEKFIVFIDSEDWIDPRYFECLLKYLLEFHADVVICGQTTDNIKFSLGIYEMHIHK